MRCDGTGHQPPCAAHWTLSCDRRLVFLPPLTLFLSPITSISLPSISRHPQLLHYSVEDGIKPRVRFLQGIGLSQSEVAHILMRLPQVRRRRCEMATAGL